MSASSLPYTFGDIGLQTAGVLPANADAVRVTLNAYVRLEMSVSANPTITPNATITIRRNNTIIFTTVYQKAENETDITYELAGITAVDYPPAAAVLGGQIRYTISVSTNYGVTLGARSFSGIAVAGNS